MIILIATITIILYILLISSTMHSLKLVESTKVKVGFIVTGFLLMLVSIWVTFYISISGLNYENAQIVGKVRNLLVAVFVPVNGLIVMPYLAKMLSKIGSNELTQEKFKKRLVILAIIYFAILIFECSYFKSTQIGILEMIEK